MHTAYRYLLAGGLILQLHGMETEDTQSPVPTLQKLCRQAIAGNPELVELIQQAAVSKNTAVTVNAVVVEVAADKVLLDSSIIVTTENIDQFRAAVERIGQDMTQRQLQQAAHTLALQKQDTTSNFQALKTFVLNFSDEQNGKLRFKLLTWFMHHQNSKLPAVEQLYLGWEYLFVENNQARKDTLTKALATLIIQPKDLMDINVLPFVTRRATPEYNALHKELASSCASSTCVCLGMSIEAIILFNQGKYVIKIYDTCNPEEKRMLGQFARVTITAKIASIPPYTPPTPQGTNP